MVLKDRPRPAWLDAGGAHTDVVLSSRARLARNLKGHQFATTASTEELNEVMETLLAAGQSLPADIEVFKGLTTVERDYFVGARLLSPDFQWTFPARALMLDRQQLLSLMINEEDHLRAQVLTAGWSVREACDQVYRVADLIEGQVPFAHNEKWGYLGASFYNSGEGRRLSAMLHLIGLAHSDRLNGLINALTATKITIRGLFGETSRAIGAYAQVSLVNGTLEQFEGVCEYLMVEERQAREAIGNKVLKERAVQALDFANSVKSISLSDAVRSLGWLRWARVARIEGFPGSARTLDYALSSLDMRLSESDGDSGSKRADALRKLIQTH